MLHHSAQRTLGIAIVGLLFTGAMVVGAPGAKAAAPADAIGFGMDIGSIKGQGAQGVKADYGQLWVGPWTLKHGWGGTDKQLAAAYAAEVTPVIQFYYWGDDISRACIEDGCWSDLHDARKDREGWDRLAVETVAHVKKTMDGRPVVIILETEFNKGDAATYEKLDGYLEQKAFFFKEGYPAAVVVLGFGNWARGSWGTFDRAAAAVDWTGIQGLRGSTRDRLAAYRGVVDETVVGGQELKRLFGKPFMVTDFGLSSYPAPDYVEHQEDVLASLVGRLDDLKALGLRALIYRSFRDSPTMDTANYYGKAERHWGLALADGTPKAAFAVWKEAVLAERAPVASAVSADSSWTMESEDFEDRTAGGAEPDSTASKRVRWNLWSDGYIRHPVAFAEAGTYEVRIRAQGTSVDGVGPTMVVRFAGSVVLEAEPRDGRWTRHDVAVEVAQAETRMIRIDFTNDEESASGDRNLLLDVVEIVWLPPANHAPSASFVASPDGLAVSVDGTGSSDPDGDALGFVWDWGDGTPAGSGDRDKHVYAQPGTYRIALLVDDGQESAEATDTVQLAIPAVRRVEAEAFQNRTAGGAEDDATASGGVRWNLWTDGYVRHDYRFDAPGAYEITIRAQGHELSGVAPAMVVRFAGDVAWKGRVPGGDWSEVVVPINATEAGVWKVRIDFTNDEASSSGDRNLLLDVVDVAPAAEEHGSDPPEEEGGSERPRPRGGGGGGGGGGSASEAPEAPSPSQGPLAEYDLSNVLVAQRGVMGVELRWPTPTTGDVAGYVVWRHNGTAWNVLARPPAESKYFLDANGTDAHRYKVTFFQGATEHEGYGQDPAASAGWHEEWFAQIEALVDSPGQAALETQADEESGRRAAAVGLALGGVVAIGVIGRAAFPVRARRRPGRRIL